MSIEPTDPEREAPAEERAPVVEHCYRHPSVETGVHCTRCGRPICPDCMIPAAVGYQCPECVGRARREFRMGPRRRMRSLAATSVTTWLLAAIGVMFLLELVVSGGSLNVSGQAAFDLGASFPPAIAAGQWWRVFTAMFLHAGLIHLFFNSYVLWQFGMFVENALGRVRMLGAYLVSGFLGGAASYAFGRVGAIGVGASGAIFGLLGVFVVYNYRRRANPSARALLQQVSFWILLNALLPLFLPAIDWRAHLGGFVAGLAVGFTAEGFGPRRYHRAVAVLGFVGVAAIGVGLVLWRTADLRSSLGPLLG
ncbi:MAG: rhomboid family intramembrane serine protease [Actinobacteria bacterium]|nr:rhomboid family intramembrane serine protease [Actinomycetota bacterium]